MQDFQFKPVKIAGEKHTIAVRFNFRFKYWAVWQIDPGRTNLGNFPTEQEANDCVAKLIAADPELTLII